MATALLTIVNLRHVLSSISRIKTFKIEIIGAFFRNVLCFSGSGVRAALGGSGFRTRARRICLGQRSEAFAREATSSVLNVDGYGFGTAHDRTVGRAPPSNDKENAAPCSGWLSAISLTSIASANALAMASPSPLPLRSSLSPR